MSTILQEAAQDADERALRQATRRQALEARFRDIASGKAWYEGTGHGDQVFPHQWTAMCFGAVAKRWFLGDEPGLGKTRTSIGWLDLVGAKKVVLIAEANVCEQFAGEIMDIAPHREMVVVLAKLSKKTRIERLNRALRMSSGILVINYEMFRMDKESLAKVLSWQADTVIVDEAHNMKTIETSNFKIVQRILFTDNTCEKCGGLITGLSTPCKRCRHIRDKETKAEQKVTLDHYLATKSVRNVCLMTGTPLLNSPEDLYSTFHLIDPVKFPTMAGFKRAFLKPSYVDGSRKQVFKRDGLERLHPYIKNFYIARTLEDVGERVEGGVLLPNGQLLPDQHVRVVRTEIDPEQYPLQARTISQVSEQARVMLSTGEKATLMHVITVILRKRQANVWPGGIEFKDDNGEVIFSVGKEVQESVKMDTAQEQILAYHAQGKRQVVFSQFKTALVEFEKRLTAAGLRVARFDGDTKERERTKIKNNFYKAKGEAPLYDVVLVHYRTGGAGLNLTAATVTHILDEEWNAGKRDQAYGRTHRIGQDEATEVLIYRIPGTVDTWMARLIQMKEDMVDNLRKVTAQEMTKKIVTAIQKGEM